MDKLRQGTGNFHAIASWMSGFASIIGIIGSWVKSFETRFRVVGHIFFGEIIITPKEDQVSTKKIHDLQKRVEHYH